MSAVVTVESALVTVEISKSPAEVLKFRISNDRFNGKKCRPCEKTEGEARLLCWHSQTDHSTGNYLHLKQNFDILPFRESHISANRP